MLMLLSAIQHQKSTSLCAPFLVLDEVAVRYVAYYTRFYIRFQRPFSKHTYMGCGQILWQAVLSSFWPLKKLGLNWVCFDQVSNWIYFHNPLYYMNLQSFDFSEIGFVLHN